MYCLVTGIIIGCSLQRNPLQCRSHKYCKQNLRGNWTPDRYQINNSEQTHAIIIILSNGLTLNCHRKQYILLMVEGIVTPPQQSNSQQNQHNCNENSINNQKQLHK